MISSSSTESYITHKPDIRVYTLTPNDHFLLLGTDGFWDELKLKEVVQVFTLNKKRLFNINEL